MTLLPTTAPMAAAGAGPDMLHRRGIGLLLVVSTVGLALGGALHLAPGSFFREALYGSLMTVSLFRDQDAIWLAICFAFSLSLLWSHRRNAAPFPFRRRLNAISPEAPPVTLYACLIALAVLAFTGFGAYAFHQSYDVVRDEHLPQVQAEIFLSGRLLAPYAEDWSGMTQALFPQFFYDNPEHRLWGSPYRPVHAAIRAAFSLLSLDAMTNPVLTALSVLLIVGIARRLWPDRPDAAVLAAVLLATGPQFLFTGMSGFAWPAHLCLNLLWLRLYLRDDGLGHGLAALVGFAAIGLHQINPHALFVLPFMLALLAARRWGVAAFYAAVYGSAALIWTFWQDIAVYLTAGPQAAQILPEHGTDHVGRALSRMGLSTFLYEPLMAFNFLRLFAWQNILILPLIYVALRRWTAAPPTVRLLAWGFVLSMIPYVLIMPNQYYGWGYRYLHGLLGSFALIAVHGWVVLSTESPAVARSARQAVIAFSILVLAIGLPLRAVQMTTLLRPMAEANRYIQSLQTDVVLVDSAGIWFRYELIRNDPFLTGQPVVLSLLNLTMDQLRQVCERYSVTVFDHRDAAQFGVILADRSAAFGAYDKALHDVARGEACGAGDRARDARVGMRRDIDAR